MSEQTFADAVRESRIFFRRRLAERLAAQIRSTGGFDPELIADRARDLAFWLFEIEDKDLPPVRQEGSAAIADAAILDALDNSPGAEYARTIARDQYEGAIDSDDSKHG